MADILSMAGEPHVESARKREFLDHMAQVFEAYVEENGIEPEALYTVLGGLKQRFRCGYLVQGDSRGGATTFQAAAAMAIMEDIIAPGD